MKEVENELEETKEEIKKETKEEIKKETKKKIELPEIPEFENLALLKAWSSKLPLAVRAALKEQLKDAVKKLL